MRSVYIKMNVYNAFKKCDEGEETQMRNTDPRVNELMTPLFIELSKKRPAWTYVCKGYGDMDSSGSYYLYNRFTIIDGDEELGEVWASKNWRTNEFRYAFNNSRLVAARSRGNSTETKELKKAANLILKNMYARTLPELMATERSKAIGAVRSTLHTTHREYRYILDRLMPDIMAFVANKYDDFIITGSSTLPDKEKLLDLYESSQRAKVTERAIGSTNVLVAERNGQFHIEYPHAEGTFHSYTLDELPMHIKEAVAILKLCAVDTLVDGIGMRTAAKTFYILKGGN